MGSPSRRPRLRRGGSGPPRRATLPGPRRQGATDCRAPPAGPRDALPRLVRTALLLLEELPGDRPVARPLDLDPVEVPVVRHSLPRSPTVPPQLLRGGHQLDQLQVAGLDDHLAEVALAVLTTEKGYVVALVARIVGGPDLGKLDP